VAAAFVAAAAAPAAAKIKVACIGASTTQGSGAPAGQSYPDQLGRLLGDEYEVRNFGKSGAGALRQGNPTYWNSAEFNAATAYQPDIVINWLGGADSKAASWDAHEGEFLGDYKGMIQHFQGLPTRPRVISMLSVALYDDAGVRKRVLEGEVNPLQRQGAMETGSPLVDTKAVVDGHPEYFADGVHLKAIGYAAVARAAHAALLASTPDAGADAAADAGRPDAVGSAGADAAAPAPDVGLPAPRRDAAPAPPRAADASITEPDPPATEPPMKRKSGGCAVAGSATVPLPFVAGLVAWLLRRRRGRGLLALIVVLGLAGGARAETPAAAAKRDATRMFQAFASGDLEAFVKYTYPALVKAMGGEAKMVAFLQQGVAEMKKEGFAVKSSEFGAPKKMVTAGSELQTLLSFKQVMSAPGGELHSEGWLIGFSGDGGRSWTFVDAAKVDEQARKTLLPNLSPQIRYPLGRKPPRFVAKK
jgi:lysophospholipase L1-like esterase